MKNPYIEYFSLFTSSQLAPKQLQDLANGLLLSQVLSKISDFPKLTMQKNPSTFAHVFSNLKQIYKKIQEYWIQYLDKQLQCQEIDLVQVAHHQNPKQIPKIINLVIQTIILSPERDYFVSKILQTSTQTQHYFMSIVQSTLQKRKTFSPRKQREQRLQDKIIELNHQNENLQNVIVQICKQKQDMQNLYKKAQVQISSKQAQIKKLNQTLADFTETPKKIRQDCLYDTHEKNAQIQQKLKQKVIQMTKQHQKQLFSFKQQIQYLSHKTQLVAHLQNQIQMYKIKLQANNESIQQYSELSRKYAQMKLNLIQKQQIANQYARKLNVKTTKLQQLEDKLVEMELQLSRKNVQIEELNRVKNTFAMEEKFHGINGLSLQKSLSEHCPQVANSQAQFLYQSNKKLRQQLQRSTTTIRQLQCQLQKSKKLCQKRESFQTQNKKLLSIIEQAAQKHDQQKTLILGCLYQTRMKTVNQLAPRERAKRLELKNSLKADNNRIISKGNNLSGRRLQV